MNRFCSLGGVYDDVDGTDFFLPGTVVSFFVVAFGTTLTFFVVVFGPADDDHDDPFPTVDDFFCR